MEKTQKITDQFLNKEIPNIKVGDTVKVHQKIKEGDKQRTQIFEGLVLANKHGKGIQGTISVRRIIGGVGVEKTFPLHSPLVEKIEIVSRGKVRRSKLYYLRSLSGKKAKIKREDYIPSDKPTENTENKKEDKPEEKPEEIKQPEQPQPKEEPKQEEN